MTEQELREKIINTITNLNNICRKGCVCKDCKYENYDNCTEYAIANALIAANIGYVSEWKHRAEVAELVVKNLNDIFTFDYQTVFEQAEKELAEEEKE